MSYTKRVPQVGDEIIVRSSFNKYIPTRVSVSESSDVDFSFYIESNKSRLCHAFEGHLCSGWDWPEDVAPAVPAKQPISDAKLAERIAHFEQVGVGGSDYEMMLEVRRLRKKLRDIHTASGEAI